MTTRNSHRGSGSKSCSRGFIVSIAGSDLLKHIIRRGYCGRRRRSTLVTHLIRSLLPGHFIRDAARHNHPHSKPHYLSRRCLCGLILTPRWKAAPKSATYEVCVGGSARLTNLSGRAQLGGCPLELPSYAANSTLDSWGMIPAL